MQFGMADEFVVARTEGVHRQLADHVLRADGQEDIGFVLWHPSMGRRRHTALLAEFIEPRARDRNVHGNASFEPQYFLRAADLAVERGCGIALIHSHPRGRGWQGMSRADHAAERSLAAQALAVSGLPLVGLTMASDEILASRLWPRHAGYESIDASASRRVGARMFIDRPTSFDVGEQPTHLRTVAAWGPEIQALIAQLRVAVVGAGSVGLLVGQMLARIGVGEILIIDHDTIREHNLDRSSHASWLDVRVRRPKAILLKRVLDLERPWRGTMISAYSESVVTAEGFDRVLDCDVIFSGVDRPWPRLALNLMAFAHLIPVVDGGIFCDARRGRWMSDVAITSHVAVPGRACLECIDQYDPAHVSMERDGSLDDPSYLQRLPDDDPLRVRQNVFPFAQMSAALDGLQFVSMIAGADPNVGRQHYHLSTGEVEAVPPQCRDGCLFNEELVARGDDAGIDAVGVHQAALDEVAYRSGLDGRGRAIRMVDDLLYRVRVGMNRHARRDA